MNDYAKAPVRPCCVASEQEYAIRILLKFIYLDGLGRVQLSREGRVEMSILIEHASVEDAVEILSLQKLAYRSEAEIYNDFGIEPLVQSLEQFQTQFNDHVVLKAVFYETIIGSVRAIEKNCTCYIGKLMVHPNHQNQGIGSRLMNAIEGLFPKSRYELFTGSKSTKNIRLYEKLGYTTFCERTITSDFGLVYLEKRN